MFCLGLSGWGVFIFNWAAGEFSFWVGRVGSLHFGSGGTCRREGQARGRAVATRGDGAPLRSKRRSHPPCMQTPRCSSRRVPARTGPPRHEAPVQGGRGCSSDSISTVGRGVSTLSARHLTEGVGGLRGFSFLIRCAFILGRSVSPSYCGTCTGFGAGVPFDDGKGMCVCIPHVPPFPPPAADTCRRSSRSLLLPTSITATWWEDSRRASRSHSPT